MDKNRKYWLAIINSGLAIIFFAAVLFMIFRLKWEAQLLPVTIAFVTFLGLNSGLFNLTNVMVKGLYLKNGNGTTTEGAGKSEGDQPAPK